MRIYVCSQLRVTTLFSSWRRKACCFATTHRYTIDIRNGDFRLRMLKGIVVVVTIIFWLSWLQNIDTLERVAGVPGETIVEAHGTFHTSHCLACRREYSLDWMKGTQRHHSSLVHAYINFLQSKARIVLQLKHCNHVESNVYLCSSLV
jgi:hypothetical protein